MNLAATIVVILVSVCVVMVFLFWPRIKLLLQKRKDKSTMRRVVDANAPSPAQVQDRAERIDPVANAVKPLYKPQDIGHRTGNKRVFITNKGLRTYDTNEKGLPMPTAQSER